VRERFAFGRHEATVALSRLAESDAVREAVLLSTCNRTELYLSLDRSEEGEDLARRALAGRGEGGVDANLRYLYQRRDRGAVEHLFRVAAGLDSMVVGEPQIQGQVREAYLAACGVAGESGPVVGPTLNRLFQNALGIGGRVRSETGLGVGSASVSSAAVDLAKKIFGSLSGRRALLLGAGEMSEVTLECLRSEGVNSCLVANRTFQRAEELAAKWEGRAVHWHDLGPALGDADIVICSTAAPHPVLTRDDFRAALPGGARRPLCIIDIAIPRDVEPAVGDENNVFLYNVDDLQQIVHDNLGRRRGELPKAEAIVATGVEEYWSWFSGLAVVPTIRDLRARSEELRRSEVDRALRRLSHLPEKDRDAIEVLTRSLLNKLLHAPTVRLREAAGNGRGTSALDTVRYLFELDGRAAGEAEDVDRAEEPGDSASTADAASSTRHSTPAPRDAASPGGGASGESGAASSRTAPADDARPADSK
jgi:glutamyl-tRNA reductase